MKKKWKPFRKNQYIRECGIRIIYLEVLAESKHKTRYFVERECCGRKMSMSHRAIYEKSRKRVKRCQKCAIRTSCGPQKHSEWKPPPPYDVVMPMWPVPDVDLPPRWVPWAGKGGAKRQP